MQNLKFWKEKFFGDLVESFLKQTGLIYFNSLNGFREKGILGTDGLTHASRDTKIQINVTRSPEQNANRDMWRVTSYDLRDICIIFSLIHWDCRQWYLFIASQHKTYISIRGVQVTKNNIVHPLPVKFIDCIHSLKLWTAVQFTAVCVRLFQILVVLLNQNNCLFSVLENDLYKGIMSSQSITVTKSINI